MAEPGSTGWRERAERVLPGGVNSPVRAFAAVGGCPPIIASASGAHLVDEDGVNYVDFILAYGPHILGHAHPAIVAALHEQAGRGTAFGATSAVEVELAERVVAAIPSVEMVRLVNSGTEATMSALRLARALTGRDRVVKCAGGYHGHADAFLAAAGSGIATLGIPGSPGVPVAAVADTIVVPYNDAVAVQAVLDREGEQVAAVIVEPVAGNMGCVLPAPGFLEALRTLTTQHGVLLIFDEVMTGFRVARGGAQQLFNVAPDLTCLGKVIGGGLPVGAFGGARSLMERLAPLGDVYQAGTLSGNPLAMAAGCAALDELEREGVYAQLESLGAQLATGLAEAAGRAGVALTVNRCGSMLTPFLGVEAVGDYAEAAAADTAGFARLHHAWREHGVLWPPSQFEAGFISMAHSAPDIALAVEGFAAGLAVAPVGSATRFHPPADRTRTREQRLSATSGAAREAMLDSADDSPRPARRFPPATHGG
ncbi:MAG: glutamate-1-semialdehyde 2,1-aminomutase [Candidatus Dormibacteraeota bacterium]|uniref:Glutamate-1-semialdehyde 2,1-aminomutase n=1 Tax=Candidatus Amunia macphersoniae TaxID=3127014 RepID=A0A934KIW2_9BACT|nr:glutamate-1-semialdehyde 2,1-aminomutase [Candidatus Dormibacteraeota bacterium]